LYNLSALHELNSPI
jgi:hypothetical protein